METLNIPIGNTQIIQGDTIPEILFEFDPTDNIDLSLPLETRQEVPLEIIQQRQKIRDKYNNLIQQIINE